MKSSTRVDSVVFQLTPTRTRFDLVITANGKSERIASGLLNPFLTHLKSAQEQIGKGGYSIILEPRRGSDAAWFTKGTVERFVRFVSTPEILERVYTIESEISQIEEAISFQSNNDTELHGQVQDQQVKYKESSQATSRKPNTCIDAVKSGSKAVLGSNEEKAIVLYKPDALAPETDRSNVQGENSKAQLLRVLETRKSVLQKEQGMAFARAVAAGFDIDHIAPLMSFAECFGATRMMEACSRFVELWKAKHKSGQWIEFEAVEEISRVDFASMNAFAIPNANDKQKQLGIQGEVPSENNDLKLQIDDHGQSDTQEHLLGQFPHHHVHPPCPVHPQAGQMPLFQPYPLPMPYYQNYPGNGTFCQPLYPSVDGSGLHSGQMVNQRKHLMDNGELNTKSEILDIDASKRAIYHGPDIDEDSQSRERTEKGGKTARKPSGTVVIRNINYIASKKQNSSDSGSQSSSDSEDIDDDKTMNANTYCARNKNLQRRSKRGGFRRTSDDAFQHLDKEDDLSGHAGDDGHWQAFQNFLLRDADEDNNSGKSSMFAMEGKVPGRKRQAAVGDDPSILGRRQKDGEVENRHDVNGDMRRSLKTSRDGLTLGGDLGQSTGAADNHLDIQFAEMGGRSVAYMRNTTASDELMIHRHDKLSGVPSSASHPYVVDQFGYRNVHNRNSSHDMADESFIVPCRSSSIDQVGDEGRTAIDMDSEVPLGSQNLTGMVGAKCNYEPYDLNMMPDRVTENGAANHDPALDYELQAAKIDGGKKSADVKQGSKKVGNDQGLKSQKKPTTVTKRGKPSKLSPSEEARARAERLRSFKADLQKVKKAKEEEQIKRLEALKIERQKRIAARSSGGGLARSPLPSPQTKKLQPTKLSPASQKGSKFSDSEPGSSSPLQRSTVKTISRLSGDPHKNSRSGRLNFTSPSGGNRLTRSASSLSERKEENKGSTPDSKASMARIRRLSEPKGNSYRASSIPSASEKSLSRRSLKGSEMKKTPATAKPEITKSAALPESNIKESKGLSNVAEKKNSIKEPTQKMHMRSVHNASASVIGGSDRVSSQNDYDENTVVEKTVVMLECEKPPVIQESGEKMHIQSLKSALDPTKGKSSENVAVQPRISPINVKGINGGTVECQLVKASPSDEAGAASAEKVLPKVSTTDVTEKPYNAPYARVSSLEDPCMEKSEYARPPPASNMATAGTEFTTARVSSSMTAHTSNSRQQNLDKIWEASEKPPEKEPSKGLKRLLKFGRKKHSSSAGESNLESDLANQDGFVAVHNVSHIASSGEVTTLKNLISEGEGSSAYTTPQKSSRSFSLLSPFRIKSSEKKLNT